MTADTIERQVARTWVRLAKLLSALREPVEMSDEEIIELARQHTRFNGSHAMTNYPAFARAIIAAAGGRK